jgi:hypothetical protein
MIVFLFGATSRNQASTIVDRWIFCLAGIACACRADLVQSQPSIADSSAGLRFSPSLYRIFK